LEAEAGLGGPEQTSSHDIEKDQNDITGSTTTPTIANQSGNGFISNSSISSATAENEASTPPNDATIAPKPEEPEASRTTFQTFIIMASLCSSVFLAALDMSIITTALVGC
jgi:hypothetical protein